MGRSVSATSRRWTSILLGIRFSTRISRVPGSDQSSPIVLFFAGDVVAAREPPRQRFPRNAGGVPARPQRHGALTLFPGPLLDESNHAGANPVALTLARNVDVDQLEHFAPILDRHAAHDPTLEFGDQDFLGADVIRLTPGGRKPVDIREEGIRTHRPEPDIF